MINHVTHRTPELRRARRALRLIGVLLLFTTIVGRAWDGWWHINYPFDGFWSPPHVFVYVMTSLVGLLVARLAFDRELRAQFGPGFHTVGLPFAVPGPLFLLGGALVALGIAGMVLDNIWHSSFGLNETPWSLPHAMIGAALALAAVGHAACSVALSGGLGWGRALFYGTLIVSVFQVLLGPIGQNNSVAAVEALGRIPVLAAQPAFQQSLFLCISNNLTRGSPALVLLGPFWVGLSLAAVRGICPQRGRAVVAVSALWSLMALDREERAMRWLDQFGPVSADPASWLPLPILLAALLWACCRRLGCSDRRAWALAGLAFGVSVASGWATEPLAWLLVPLAAPLAVWGARLGDAVAAAVLQPTKPRCWWLVAGIVIVFPLVAGSVDLLLRLRG